LAEGGIFGFQAGIRDLSVLTNGIITPTKAKHYSKAILTFSPAKGLNFLKSQH
jgi:hypothetical protein